MDNLFVFFDNKIQVRYITMLKNIKYRSNSFFDSYLTLCEQLFRSLIKKEIKVI